MKVSNKPIEPRNEEGILGRTYYKVLKNCLQEKDENPGRSFLKTLGFGMFFPGSGPYIRYRGNEVTEEIANEKGKKFTSFDWDEKDTFLSWGLEAGKIAVAYQLSLSLSKYLW